MGVHPALAKLEIVVLKDKNPPADLAQVPALAYVRFHRIGATVKTAVTLPVSSNPVTIDVFSKGVLVTDEVAHAGGRASLELVVHDIMAGSPGQMRVRNNTTSPIALTAGMRIVSTANRVPVYLDPTATTGIIQNMSTDAATGRLAVYVAEYRYDYVVEVSATDVRVFADAEGSYVMR